jgi:hypothetical protein
VLQGGGDALYHDVARHAQRGVKRAGDAVVLGLGLEQQALVVGQTLGLVAIGNGVVVDSCGSITREPGEKKRGKERESETCVPLDSATWRRGGCQRAAHSSSTR